MAENKLQDYWDVLKAIGHTPVAEDFYAAGFSDDLRKLFIGLEDPDRKWY